MLDPRFKNFHIVSSFVEGSKVLLLLMNMIEKPCILMLVKCYEHLHPLLKLDRNCADQDSFEQDCNLDILEQIASTSELVEELVKRKLLIFWRYQLDIKDINCPFQWW
jgi:hypothetical protein